MKNNMLNITFTLVFIALLFAQCNKLEKPIASFTSDVTSIDEGGEVSFTDNSKGDITRWYWDFGDGYESQYPNPHHIYEESGKYTVALTVSNNEGSDIEKKYDYITVNGYDTYTDSRDGQVYKIITIGSQTWFAENFAYKPNSVSYNYNETNVDIYGRLYEQSYAINYAPPGWHLPSVSEWRTLVNFLGGEDVAGGKLKEKGTEYWNFPNTGATNSSFFNALPGGYADNLESYGGFSFIKEKCYFWASDYDVVTEIDCGGEDTTINNDSYCVILNYDKESVVFSTVKELCGPGRLYVRYIKDNK